MLTLGEYLAIATMCAMGTILFLGGWLPPLPVLPFTWIPGIVWFVLKAGVLFFMFAMAPDLVLEFRGKRQLVVAAEARHEDRSEIAHDIAKFARASPRAGGRPVSRSR